MSEALRFVILDDHPLVRRALADNLSRGFGDIRLCYEGASVADAIHVISEEGCDCAILDLDLGDQRSPVSNVEELHSAGIPILVVSALGDPALVRATLFAGALGFISKQAAIEHFVSAVQAAINGEQYMSPEIAAALLAEADVAVELSDRERTAMTLYASGLKMASVARQMDVSVGTAQEYIKRVRAKYARSGNPLSTKTELYQQARSEGMLPNL
ncbi:MAG: response regulator transcription factor [Actinomycetota bacterium]|nr:response regulator transcription factor [Actinomycetota bacterium]